MNANATTAIRELSAQELDQVTGGITHTAGEMDTTTLYFVTAFAGAAIGSLLAGFFDWLFG